MNLSVIICTHNPRADYLRRVLDALRDQTLPKDRWELLLIDNASSEPLGKSVDVAWHPRARIIREEKLGLTHARLRAAREAKEKLLVFSDDDTVFDPGYLSLAGEKIKSSSTLGVLGGPSLPEYETPPAEWFRPDLAPLGCRDLGAIEQAARWDANGVREYPGCAPIGAGMVIRREVLEAWAALVANDPKRQALGRTGAALSSGEDNDINLVALARGWEVGYLPGLKLKHLISARRLDQEYLEKLSFASSRDWMRVLALHRISPWPPVPGWTVPLRKMKAWFTCRAWAGPAERIRWRGACGHFEGRVMVNHGRRGMKL